MKILVTGSCGLIGAEAATYFGNNGHEIVGLDNNMRRVFFGEAGDTSWMRARLENDIDRYRHIDASICDREAMLSLFEKEKFDAVIHCAAQPSHDKAAQIPLLDFDVNAVGTVNLLESNRQFSPQSPFIFMSTNKVYGDTPNNVALTEHETRYDFADPELANGIAESFSIDASTHSVFGASKVAADVMVQEYGRYFDMPTCCLRGGCLTGPEHSAVELHGFLSYLTKCHLTGTEYTIFGYKGKQVRDNIHSVDVVRFFDAFLHAPRSAAVYNLGGGRDNSISVREAFTLLEDLTGKPANWKYSDKNRIGDHMCYYSDLSRMKADYPEWDITIGIKQVMEDLVEGWSRRLGDR